MKTVSKNKSIGLIVFACLCALILLIPATFGDIGFNFGFKAMPLIGDEGGSYLYFCFASYVYNVLGLLSFIPVEIADIIVESQLYAIYFFMGITVFNLLFGILLLITKSNVLRLVCKVISIIAGIAFIVLLLDILLAIAGVVIIIVNAGENAGQAFMEILSGGCLLMIVWMLIMSIVGIGKQFTGYNSI